MYYLPDGDATRRRIITFTIHSTTETIFRTPSPVTKIFERNFCHTTDYAYQHLVLTKSSPQKVPQSEMDQSSVKAISKMRRRTSMNKKNIDSSKKIIEELKNIDKLNLKTVKSRLREQLKIMQIPTRKYKIFIVSNVL